MARGDLEKAEVRKKILEMFPGSFEVGKDIRVPMGEIEIKIVTTTAKDVLGGGGSPAPSKTVSMDTSAADSGNTDLPWSETFVAGPSSVKVEEPSADEIQAIADLMASLNF